MSLACKELHQLKRNSPLRQLANYPFRNHNKDKPTASYLFLSFAANASNLGFSLHTSHLFPNSFAMSPTPYEGYLAFTDDRSSLQKKKKADLKLKIILQN